MGVQLALEHRSSADQFECGVGVAGDRGTDNPLSEAASFVELDTVLGHVGGLG